MSEAATKLLSETLGKTVLIKLRGDKNIRGKLRSFDIHLNIVLDDAEEIRDDGTSKKLGTVVIRGENVVLISPSG
ncbi:MAG: RNA-binding protein [Desulfurococcales archaeon]|nr:RNA-binding protein [Desulfurococcales archaeon]MCC6061573.1 RNA-binding protein [Desulfurococcales archaeon]MCI4457021.1 RNA-binding protein [Desulfurococcaceae archaeon]NAZ13349.1 RNA-binding protein [Desulfurococcales archaeon]